MIVANKGPQAQCILTFNLYIMPASAHINLKLDFDQVLDLVRQLPKKQQQQLAGIIANDEAPAKNLTAKEEAFLTGLEKSVHFVNKYKKGKSASTTFKKMLDAL